MTLSTAEANLELAILESNAREIDRVDVLTRFTNVGLPQEVVQRLRELWDAREEITGRVVHSGRIALAEIIRFIDENPNLVIGVALGAAVTSLVSFIPVLGPLALALGIVIGGLAGQKLDAGQKPGPGVVGITQELILLARKFFELLISVFNALRTPALTAAGGSAA